MWSQDHIICNTTPKKKSSVDFPIWMDLCSKEVFSCKHIDRTTILVAPVPRIVPSPRCIILSEQGEWPLTLQGKACYFSLADQLQSLVQIFLQFSGIQSLGKDSVKTLEHGKLIKIIHKLAIDRVDLFLKFLKILLILIMCLGTSTPPSLL